MHPMYYSPIILEISLDGLADILVAIGNNPLSLFGFALLLLLVGFTRLQFGRLDRLSKRIRDLPERDRLSAIQEMMKDVPEQSPETYLKSKKVGFQFAYYAATLIALILVLVIVLSFVNNLVPWLVPFLPTPPEVVEVIPASGTVEAKLDKPIQLERFEIDLQGCVKASTSSTQCSFLITNLAGDRNFRVNAGDSRLIENTGEALPCDSVQISNNQPSNRSSRFRLISGIATKASFTFGGVGESINSVGAAEFSFSTDNTTFKLQYRNVPLKS